MKNTKSNRRHYHGKAKCTNGNAKSQRYHKAFRQQKPVIGSHHDERMLDLLEDLCDILERLVSHQALTLEWQPEEVVCRMFGMPWIDLWNLYESGEIASRTVDGIVFVRPADVEQYLEERLEYEVAGKAF
jgi:hypothetical protein